MKYQSPSVGQEISCVMKLVSSKFLLEPRALKKILKQKLSEENFGILKITSHTFEPHGFTLFFLLSESHLAIHTYPEYNSIYFNFYSCRGPADAEPTFKFIKEKLKPKEILFLRKDKVPLINPQP